MNKQPESEIFTIPARRCKRCGGLLTSAEAIRDGYGSCCLRKAGQHTAGLQNWPECSAEPEACKKKAAACTLYL